MNRDKEHLKALLEGADAGNERDEPPEKIGRNQPCPCGSGSKYKYCCLKKR